MSEINLGHCSDRAILTHIKFSGNCRGIDCRLKDGPIICPIEDECKGVNTKNILIKDMAKEKLDEMNKLDFLLKL